MHNKRKSMKDFDSMFDWYLVLRDICATIAPPVSGRSYGTYLVMTWNLLPNDFNGSYQESDENELTDHRLTSPTAMPVCDDLTNFIVLISETHCWPRSAYRDATDLILSLKSLSTLAILLYLNEDLVMVVVVVAVVVVAVEKSNDMFINLNAHQS
uniref:Uncharacterized protein n=1 Tax=Glossina austeni TaxID=7395 RepID=A0A1A9UUY4_GLOAU